MQLLPFQVCRPLSSEGFTSRPTQTSTTLDRVEPRERFTPTSQRFSLQPSGGLGESGTASSKLQALARDGVITPTPARQALKLRRGELLEDGSQGKRVRQLQRMLNTEGSKLRRDGIFGPRTEREVERFQKRHGLVVDGIVGAKTLRKLNEVYLGKSETKAAVKTKQPEATRPQPEAVTKPQAQVAARPQPETVAKPQAQVVARPQPETPAKSPSPSPRPSATPPNYGLSPETLERLEKGGKLEAFRKLPPQISERYGQLSPRVRQQLFQQLSGSTWGVSHREAFVRGSAMGMDAFKMMGDKLQKAAAEGKISPTEARQLQQDMQQLRALRPEQRSLVAEVILLQKGR